METNKYSMTFSESITPFIYTMSDGDSLADKANMFMIIGMFVAKSISLEKAAELAKKSVWDFVELLKKYNIPWGEYTEESNRLDDVALMKLSGGLYE